MPPDGGLLGAHGLGGLQREAAREDRQPAEQDALRLGQQVVTPVDGGAQRLVPRDGRAAAGGQQREAVVQAGGDLLHRKHLHAGGGQFDRQRDAVQALADLHHVRRVLLGEGKAGVGIGGALSNSRMLSILRSSFERQCIPRPGQRQRRHLPDRLAEQPQPLDAGGQDAQVRAGAQQLFGVLRAGRGSCARNCPGPAAAPWLASGASPSPSCSRRPTRAGAAAGRSPAGSGSRRTARPGSPTARRP